MPLLPSLTTTARIASAFARAGVLAPVSPRALLKIRAARGAYGASLGSLSRIAAIRNPDGLAVVDDRRRITFAELDQRVDAVAAALHARHGVDASSSVALLCRNHGGALETILAASRLGADVVLLNTDFSGPQLAQSLAREQPTLLVVDDEFLPAVAASGSVLPVVLAWTEGATIHPHDTIDHLATRVDPRPPHPSRAGRVTILTSGTTGVPRGAPRPIGSPQTFGLAATALARTGLRSGDPIMVASPLFHGFGLAVWVLSLSLRSPVVLMRRFDADRALSLIERHEVAGVGLIPLMMHRLIAASAADPSPPNRASLRAVLCGGAPVTPNLAARTEAAWGPVLFNAYGSSEVGIATFGTADDLRRQAGSVGQAILGYSLAILDEAGRSLPAGTPGRIFVGGPMVFSGYSGDGGSKEQVDGRMSTGDRGVLDAQGRLAVLGREDDMILSGGENVYPQEVEDLLLAHPAVDDAAVLGVADPEFGERLAAYVVRADPQLTEAAVREHVKARLARYKTPRDVLFVEEIPRNASGKILRRVLRERQPTAPG